MLVRTASENDLDHIVALSAEVRARLAIFDPHFWRPHDAANETQLAWFAYLLKDPGHVVLVAELDREGELHGFVIGRLMDAPPVYDPGGQSVMVDDFAWRSPAVSKELLAAVRAWAVAQGAVTLVVVTAAADQDRKEVLAEADLHATSEWWSTALR